MRILLTGATSSVGAEVLKALLKRPEVTSIQLLQPEGFVRANSKAEALPPHSIVEGELELPRFGFSFSAWETFAGSFDVGIHCAQRETQDQNLEEARRCNVLPVENWIALLEQNPALRLHHLSTALTAGTRHGLYTEFDLECGQGFHNAYERSKYEAEVRLRESRVSDRVTVHRPSHGAYPLLAMLASASVLPGDGRARIDLVPADYVASAMTALAIANAPGTFHHACGWHASLTVKQAASIAAKATGRRRGSSLLPRVAPAIGRVHDGARFSTQDRCSIRTWPIGHCPRTASSSAPGRGSNVPSANAWSADAAPPPSNRAHPKAEALPPHANSA
jgi:nucleoside-diphosphate-sugar epimerase